ncbi:hypothetical protein [Virgibacillus doumboii]|uniref:hypothetical protein n=1 Tax=Virgibacillus doumboii TaxID=2697503 RepID=UPI0013DF3B0C|nr:hypothetical protein [Virgibacillus doumboii]
MNNKGFSFIETLTASALLLMMATTLIPITNVIINEKEILYQKRLFLNELHDELQLYLWDDRNQTPAIYDKEVDSVTLTFMFSKQNSLVKGCVEWKNVKRKNEQVCLFGFPD